MLNSINDQPHNCLLTENEQEDDSHLENSESVATLSFADQALKKYMINGRLSSYVDTRFGLPATNPV